MINTYVDTHGDTLMMAGGALQAVDLRIVEADAPMDAGVPMVRVDNDDLPAFVAALYQAAGKPAPIMLERPAARDMLVPGPHREELVQVTPSPAGHPSNAPGVLLNTGSTGAVRLVGDEVARVAVALIDAMTQAGGEPDPAEAEELARVIYEDHSAYGYDMSQRLARHILRRGYSREAAS